MNFELTLQRTWVRLCHSSVNWWTMSTVSLRSVFY